MRERSDVTVLDFAFEWRKRCTIRCFSSFSLARSTTLEDTSSAVNILSTAASRNSILISAVSVLQLTMGKAKGFVSFK
jgi:hypothetical protein